VSLLLVVGVIANLQIIDSGMNVAIRVEGVKKYQ
jgi:hypothetical protein